MPMAPMMPVLMGKFLGIFQSMPTSQADAAQSWASAYEAYCLAGGIPVPPPKTQLLSTMLKAAFNPNLLGAGPALMIAALLAFWIGMPVPGQGGIVVLFIPSDMQLKPSGLDNATAVQQAQGLAQTFHLLTMNSVKVQVGPNIVPLL